jgi:hypothetical protein
MKAGLPATRTLGEGVMGELSNPRYEQFVQELAGNTAVFTMRARLEEVIHGYRVWARFVEDADSRRGN